MTKDDRADVTTDGQASLSNGTLQRKRTGIRASAVERTLPDEFRLGNRSERCRRD
jgi:hypothetical protein